MKLASKKLVIGKNGRDKGIMIPFAMLKRCNIVKQAEVEIENDRIILKPTRAKPRKGWGKGFSLMHRRKEDTLLE